jgi:hypothetical protein
MLTFPVGTRKWENSQPLDRENVDWEGADGVPVGELGRAYKDDCALQPTADLNDLLPDECRLIRSNFCAILCHFCAVEFFEVFGNRPRNPTNPLPNKGFFC